jgi:DNA polymerase III alpha subunit
VTIGGIVTSYRKKLTKKGDMMGFFRLEDLEGAIEVILVPRFLNVITYAARGSSGADRRKNLGV